MTRRTLHRGIREAAAADPRLARVVARHGLPAPRGRPPGFAGLLRAIVGQQISIHAAAAIWRRLTERLGATPDPTAFLALDDPALRAVGLSDRKRDYARDLARRVDSGALPLDTLHRLTDEEVVARLTAVRGIGRWSAEIYLLFALGRPDAFPVGDLGLRVAMERLRMTRGRPDERRALARAARWAPWRGCVAFLLWHALAGTPAPGGRPPGRAQPLGR